MVIFIAIQIWKGDNGTVTPRIIKECSIVFGSFTLCGSGSIILVAYYLQSLV